MITENRKGTYALVLITRLKYNKVNRQNKIFTGNIDDSGIVINIIRKIRNSKFEIRNKS